MKETVLLTGATSFIARHLIPLLETSYHVKLLTRNPQNSNEFRWNIEQKELDESALDQVDYIIHLAGAKLNDGTPLTEERKKIVYDSRIGAARLLKETLQRRKQKITSFISASAIGYYAENQTMLYIDESGLKGTGFSARLSDDWEKAADEFQHEGVAKHVAKIRVSLVLGNEGGIFPLYKQLVQRNPAIAKQESTASFPWNHVADMAGIFAFAVTHRLEGTFNTVAPEAATLQDIFKRIANQTQGTSYEVTPFEGQRIIANKIIEEGYVFQYPTLQKAI